MELKPEIWLNIIDKLYKPLPKGGQPAKRKDLAQNDLASMMRVCKLFHSLASPILYQCVVTDDISSLFRNHDSPAACSSLQSKRESLARVQYLYVEEPHESVESWTYRNIFICEQWEGLSNKDYKESPHVSMAASFALTFLGSKAVHLGKLMPKLQTYSVAAFSPFMDSSGLGSQSSAFIVQSILTSSKVTEMLMESSVEHICMSRRVSPAGLHGGAAAAHFAVIRKTVTGEEKEKITFTMHIPLKEGEDPEDYVYGAFPASANLKTRWCFDDQQFSPGGGEPCVDLLREGQPILMHGCGRSFARSLELRHRAAVGKRGKRHVVRPMEAEVYVPFDKTLANTVTSAQGYKAPSGTETKEADVLKAQFVLNGLTEAIIEQIRDECESMLKDDRITFKHISKASPCQACGWKYQLAGDRRIKSGTA